MKSNYTTEDKFSRKIRAGKRVYFFDVKATKGNDHYIVITESKKSGEGEEPTFVKNKLFLYKEDFDKFLEALTETIDAAKTSHSATTHDPGRTEDRR